MEAAHRPERLERRLLDAFLAHTQEYVYVKDRDGRYVVASASMAQVLGYDSPDQLVGKHDTEILPEDLAGRVVERDRIVLERGEAVFDTELSGAGRNGTFWTVSSKLPLKDENGEVVGLVGVSHDATPMSASRWRRRSAISLAVTLQPRSASVSTTAERGALSR